MSHVVAVVALSRAQSKDKGRKGRLTVRSVVGEQLGVETTERWWWGYGSTAALSHGTIPGAGRSRLASDWEKRWEPLLVWDASEILQIMTYR